MVVAFHTNQLSLRGTEVALYDYAHFGEALLGLRPVILTPLWNRRHSLGALRKFRQRFRVAFYTSAQHRGQLCRRLGVEAIYSLKGGPDTLEIPGIRTWVHGVFRSCPPHGDRFAYISPFLSRTCPGNHPHVPHVVTRPDPVPDARSFFSLPDDAIVLGRHGGAKTFDMEFVHSWVYELVHREPRAHFLFLNTRPFGPKHPRVRHLRGTADATAKTRFISACDAMLHARRDGETFGLAIAEFSVLNKPVLTWSGSEDAAHLDFLGESAWAYEDEPSLDQAWRRLADGEQRSQNWDRYSERFAPEPIMRQFREVFLR